MCRVEHKKLKQMAALSKVEQSKARKLSNEHIVSKAKQTSKSKQARKQGRIEHQKLNPVKIVNFINIFGLFHKIT